MRIAIVTETWFPSTDGVVTRIVATMRELKRMGHELMVVAPRGGNPEFEGSLVRDVPNLSVFFIYGGKPWGIPLPRVGRYIAEFRPDVIHAVNPFVLGIAGVSAAKRQKIPLVASYHTNIAGYAEFYHLGFTKPIIWTILRALHNRAQVNLATSLAVKEELDQHGIKRVEVWRRGVDLSLFHPSRRREDMRHRLTGGHPERTILLYVGRIALEKGLHRLKSIFSDNPTVHLALVGDGPWKEKLQKDFLSYPVTFMGTLHGEELAEAYASSDVFVFPSTTETLGLVLLEAMASGLPIIGAESKPTHELLDESGAGAMFSPDQPELIGGLVRSFLKDPKKLERLSARARLEAEKWGWGIPTKELVQWYQKARRSRQGFV